MSFKHTPGPWVGMVERDEDGEIFTVHPAMRDGQIALVTGENASADAYLMVAAPALHEALSELVAIRDIKDKLEEPNNGEWPDMAELRARTDAAWAAARSALLLSTGGAANG